MLTRFTYSESAKNLEAGSDTSVCATAVTAPLIYTEDQRFQYQTTKGSRKI
jgi:hypothetical protein